MHRYVYFARGKRDNKTGIRILLMTWRAMLPVVELGSSASYYWESKEPATQSFAAVPFGLNAQWMSAWFHGADGLKLWEEVYAPFNLIPRPGGSTGVQMGGRFNKKINSIDATEWVGPLHGLRFGFFKAAKSPMATKVNESFKKFQKVVGTWGSISGKAYYNGIMKGYSLKG